MASSVPDRSDFFHDLRNFLFVVNQSAREALSAFERGELELADLRAIVEYSARASELLDRTDGRSCFEDGRTESDVSDLARRAAASLRYAAGGAEVELRVDPDCRAEIDALSVERIILNLVLNARDAGARRIVLAVERCRLDPAWIDEPIPRLVQSWVRIGIEDDGVGMTPEELDRATDAEFSTKVDGQGLGLSLVDRLVAQHEGVLQIGSVPGEGTRIDCYLPGAAVDPSPSQS